MGTYILGTYIVVYAKRMYELWTSCMRVHACACTCVFVPVKTNLKSSQQAAALMCARVRACVGIAEEKVTANDV